MMFSVLPAIGADSCPFFCTLTPLHQIRANFLHPRIPHVAHQFTDIFRLCLLLIISLTTAIHEHFQLIMLLIDNEWIRSLIFRARISAFEFAT